MSGSNGVVRIGRKGRKKFAFGEEGQPGSEPFELDVVNTFHQWLAIDEEFRSQFDEKEDGTRPIPQSRTNDFHTLLVHFVESLRVNSPPDREPVSSGEASDFLARLREEYDELVHFFRPKSRERQDSQDTSAAPSVQFSQEES